ncbi:MAG: glycosyltransferase family 2 protein [Aquaticitalea sp.]
MPFSFLKYLQPTNYFRLFNKNGKSAFPMVGHLPESILSQLTLDSYYRSEQARDYDLSWQAIQDGYIGDAPTYTTFVSLDLTDNYYFIRKNFRSVWALYVLCCRLFTFQNPIKEIKAWRKSAVNGIKHQEFKAFQHHSWKIFRSSLLEQQPLVSVVIPTLNRYRYLMEVLRDFEKQDYTNFEIIIIDQSDNFNLEFYQQFQLNLKVINQKEKALWLARNTAIKASNGKLIALSEDDVRINADWLSSHIKCLDFFDAKVSAGVFYPDGGSIPLNRSFFTLAQQFATGNAMVYKSVFNVVGLFDRQFEKQRMGDGEFGLRVYLEGFRSVSNPYASCIDVKAGTGGLREMGSWDAFRPSNFLAPRPIPSVLYYFRSYYGSNSARWALLKTIPLSIMPYKFKKNKPLMIIGIFLTLLLTPFIVFQVLKSWQLSSKKMKEGTLIEQL